MITEFLNILGFYYYFAKRIFSKITSHTPQAEVANFLIEIEGPVLFESFAIGLQTKGKEKGLKF